MDPDIKNYAKRIFTTVPTDYNWKAALGLSALTATGAAGLSWLLSDAENKKNWKRHLGWGALGATLGLGASTLAQNIKQEIGAYYFDDNGKIVGGDKLFGGLKLKDPNKTTWYIHVPGAGKFTKQKFSDFRPTIRQDANGERVYLTLPYGHLGDFQKFIAKYPDAKINFTGYSLGGGALLDLAKNWKRPIDAMMLVDPAVIPGLNHRFGDLRLIRRRPTNIKNFKLIAPEANLNWLQNTNLPPFLQGSRRVADDLIQYVRGVDHHFRNSKLRPGNDDAYSWATTLGALGGTSV